MLFEGQESLVGLRIIPIFWSRSKKRLYIIYSTTFSGDVNKNSFEKGITSFMSGIIGDFEDEEFVEDPIWSMKQKDINHYFHRDEDYWY